MPRKLADVQILVPDLVTAGLKLWWTPPGTYCCQVAKRYMSAVDENVLFTKLVEELMLAGF